MKHQTGNCWPTKDRLLLLKAALLPDQRAVQAWECWLQRNASSFDDVDAPSYQLYPLVYRNLAKHHVSGAIFDKCKGIYKKNWMYNQLMWHKLTPYLKQLQDNGVEKIVLLKGMAMIAGVYDDFGARTIGDVDALIPLKDAALGTQTLEKSGLKNVGTAINFANPYELSINHAVTYKIDADTILDLHWSFLTESPFTGLDDEVLRYAIPITIHGFACHIPDPTILLLHTCVHGAKSTEVASLRWVADSMTILNHHKINWERMVNMAKAAHITLPLRDTFDYLNQEFNANIPQTVVKQLAILSNSRHNRFEHWCNLHGYFFLVNWLRFCSRQGYQSWPNKLLHFPRFIQYRRRLPTMWHIYPYAAAWLGKKIFRKIRNAYRKAFI